MITGRVLITEMNSSYLRGNLHNIKVGTEEVVGSNPVAPFDFSLQRPWLRYRDFCSALRIERSVNSNVSRGMLLVNDPIAQLRPAGIERDSEIDSIWM